VGDAGSAAMDCSGCRSEFARIFLIAATGEGGDDSGARTLYQAYARGWPNRSVWRLAWYFSSPQTKLPGFKPFLDALAKAGMPQYLDERQDFHVQAPLSPVIAGDFDPTPGSLPGGSIIDANTLHDRIARNSLVIVDTCAGSATIPGALLPWSPARNGDDEAAGMRELERHLQGNNDTEIVVMGAGVTGWQPYNLGLQLIARGYRHVVWFRGGEEAWARAGYKGIDAR
jgi:rhodanese-related sulfurtransferase